jgi:hypothetical protein
LSWSIVGAGTGGHLLSLEKATGIFADEFGFLFAQIKESASACTLRNPFVFLRFFRSCSHHGIVVLNSSWKTWIDNFLGATQAIDKSLLLLNLILLQLKFIFHLFELLRQELVLFSKLLPGYGQPFVLFLGVHKIGSDSAELFLSLIDFVHVTACFEARFFDQLYDKKIQN